LRGMGSSCNHYTGNQYRKLTWLFAKRLVTSTP